MARNNLNINTKVILNTGNILSISDITKKPGHNPTEELIEAINVTVKEYLSQNDENLPDHLTFITRKDDVTSKISEDGISNLKIGLKLFLTSDNHQLLCEAIDNALLNLKIDCVDDVTVSFKQQASEDQKDNLDQIKNVWSCLEKYVDVDNIKQIGIADIEESTFRALYEWARVKPSIIQINLASCCVVPPTLQAFCKEKDVKLLTHSDQSDILPKQSIENIFGKPLDLQWAVRFVVHIKCRGVLTAKGYILTLNCCN